MILPGQTRRRSAHRRLFLRLGVGTVVVCGLMVTLLMVSQDRVPLPALPKGVNGEQAKALERTARTAIQYPPVLLIGDKKITVSRAAVSDWLTYKRDDAGHWAVVISDAKLAAYLAEVQGDAYRAPSTTTIYTIDEREVDRRTGESGQGVDTAQAAAQLLPVLRAGKPQAVRLALVPLEPKVQYKRIVSNADQGLAEVVAAAGANGSGVAVFELDGRAAIANGDKQFVAASTYKLYVAYAWFKQVADGRASWTDTVNGQSASACFETMIVNSDNPCAVAFAAKVGGWGAVDQLMKHSGLTHTSLVSGNLRTTAADLAYFLYRLQKGTLVGGADRERLVGLMKRQIYREGIVAGAPKGTAATKPGFVDGYVHDAGIVYAAKGPYVIVVMTYPGNWTHIADTTRAVQAYLSK